MSCGCSQERFGDWSRHDAHRRCGGAIAAYPEKPAPPCQAMQMCINEAELDDEERYKLLGMIRATEGCAEP